jgi:hypothetical protein
MNNIEETPEESAEKFFPNAEQVGGEYYIAYKAFIEGIKYQQRKSYSSEQVIDLLKASLSKYELRPKNGYEIKKIEK